ncbi:MAG TPA: hypothetical protein VM529_21635, partial [Gemmata sp.]|nr:hypothetical protein [Gemmata sp.]
MATLLAGSILLAAGGLLGYFFVYEPWEQKRSEAATLEAEVTDLDGKLATLNRLKPKIVEAKRQSLPPDANSAKLQYQQLLESMRPAGLPSSNDFTVRFTREVPFNAKTTPVLGPKKPAYTQLEFTVEIDNANLWQVVDFLQRYYQIDLLHRLTELSISRTNKPSDPRGQLKVKAVSEAVILDGVEPRSGLFPVTNVIAAVAGFPAVRALAASPEAVQRLTPRPTTPVLAAAGRDYSVIVKQDMFYGLLPPPESEPEFKLDRLADVTVSKPDDAPPAVRVRATGKGASAAKVEARVTGGDLLPAGPLKVDGLAIALPRVSEETGYLGSPSTATVAVTATSADGVKKESTFKVAMAAAPPPPPSPPAGPDISAAIKLVMASGSSQGDTTTTTFVIFDSANPYAYRLTTKGKGIEVVKQWSSTSKLWRPDRDYNHPDGVLAISDDFSSTKKKFRVVAFEEDAVIVADLAGTPPKADSKRPAFGKGGGGGRPWGQGPATPLAAAAGNPA